MKVSKGQINVEALLSIPVVIIMLFISLQMYSSVTTTDNMLYDLLDNSTLVPQYGGVVKLLLYMVPLLLVVLVILGIWRSASRPPEYQY